jgi:protein-S-isoprenylcysteine O-methyltransferase Ste14
MSHMTDPKLIAAALAGTLVHLAIAIVGAGGFALFFSHAPLIVLTIVTFALAFASLFTGGNLSAGEREDRANRWVLPAFFALGLLSAYFPAYTDRIDFWTFDGDRVRWIGVALFTIGGILRLWPVFVLGRRFSGLVAIQPGHKLVTSGIYRFLRHPSYLGLLIGALGWALAFRSGVGVILAALNLIPLVARMNAEEAMLISEFGKEYEDYRARTSRLIPGIY